LTSTIRTSRIRRASSFRIVAASSARQFIQVRARLSILPSPGGWTSDDVGAVGAAGTTAYGGGGWTVEGSGADVWGTADEFRYVYRVVGGNFSITTRVASIENLDRWVKAGLMSRESLSPGSRHVSLFATPRTERGIAFQRRRQTDGISVHTAGPAAVSRPAGSHWGASVTSSARTIARPLPTHGRSWGATR
jgi:hypothetical protein